jgi:ribosomal protein S18 acetylase RimI-like enzyme
LIHEAGNPYYDWFFAGSKPARAALATLLDSPSSEVSSTRVTLLFARRRLVGAYVAVGGAELARCRLADAALLLKDASRDISARESLYARMKESRKLLAPIGNEDFFLSRIGVTPYCRGQGFGRVLLEHYLATGSAAGFERFRLDVSADNSRAIELYESSGFVVASTRSLAGMTYHAMTLANAAPRQPENGS